jgi:ABC-type nitrate/sulfonate/bicarbonate transport system permease component
MSSSLRAGKQEIDTLMPQTVGADTETEALPDPRKTPESRLRQWWDRHEHAVLGLLGVLLFLVIWQLAAETGLAKRNVTSSPTDVAAAAVEYLPSADFREDLRVSATEFVWGLGLAIGIGVPAGLIFGWYRRIAAFFDPLMTGFYASPRIAFMPVFVLWFGIGIWSKVVLIVLMSVFPIIMNTMSGVRSVSSDLVRVARAFGANDRQLFRTVILPGSVPSIMSGLRIGTGLALIGIVVGELLAGTAGIGHMIVESGSRFRTDRVFVGIIVISTVGVLLSLLTQSMEKRFDKWRT